MGWISDTAYYTMWAPFTLAIIASQKIPGNLLCSEYSEFVLRLGYLFQAQDDFIDVYGDPKRTGKVGSDIREGKVTWLSCRAFELAAEKGDLLNGLKEGMGKDEARVKDIYERLRIREVFEKWEVEEISELKGRLTKLSDVYPKRTMLDLLKSLEGRSGKK
jgi:farnesyl diphosphate synthase